MKKIGFLGCGKIGHRIASHIIDHHLGKITFIQDPFFENTLNLALSSTVLPKLYWRNLT